MSKTVKIKKVQFRVLQAIAKTNGGSLSRKKIMERVFSGNSVNLAPILGDEDAKERAARDKANGYPSLLSLGMIAVEHLGSPEDGVSEVAFSITTPGKKALEAGTQDDRLPKPGSTITRQYKGKTYKVKVLASGFSYAGKQYTSLTAVAKVVRGIPTEVNGFAFFGLTKNGDE